MVHLSFLRGSLAPTYLGKLPQNSNPGPPCKAGADLLYLHTFQKNIIAAGFYDGVMLYANAVHEILEQGGSAQNGTAVTYKMWNQIYDGWDLDASPLKKNLFYSLIPF